MSKRAGNNKGPRGPGKRNGTGDRGAEPVAGGQTPIVKPPLNTGMKPPGAAPSKADAELAVGAKPATVGKEVGAASRNRPARAPEQTSANVVPRRKRARSARVDDAPREVIHVVFGPGGGRVAPVPTARSASPRPAQAGAEPLTDLFSQTEIARLLGMTASRLRTLDKSGIVSPSGRRRGRRAYTFADLIQLRTAQSLLSNKVRLRDVSRAMVSLRKTLPTVTRPLAELRIISDGREIVVKTQDGNFDALSGQRMLDFEVKDLRADVVRVLRPNAGKDRARTAYELYLKASQLDEDPATMAEAEQLYQRALELDPWLTIAYTNLGNICFRRQEVARAEELYRRALELDSKQPEAQYNLGYVMLEHGEPQASIPLFLGAIEADPRFADAYFNLAMAYEQAGQADKARPYWSSYIQLEPSGTWTEIARRHL